MEQVVIRFLYLKGRTLKEEFDDMNEVCRDDVLSYDFVKHWYTQFKCGRRDYRCRWSYLDTNRPENERTMTTDKFVSLQEPPFLMKNGDFYEGLVPDILDRITSSLNVNYTLTNMSRYGALNEKGDWTGMMDKLVNKDADVAAILTVTHTRSKFVDFSYPVMSVGPVIVLKRPPKERFRIDADVAAILTVTHTRSKFVDFSYPVMSVGPVIVLKRPPKERFRITENLDSLFQPFDFTVWLMTILAFFVTGTVLYMISHFNPYEWRRMSKDREATLREAESFTCANSFWFALSALCFQGFVRAPRSVGGRLVVTAWWIFVLLFLFSYLACLTNYLRVGPKPLEAEGYSKIRGFGDLAKTDDIKVLVVPYGATENYFKTAVLETEKRIYKKIVDTRKVLSIDGRDDGIEKIKESAFSDIVMILESSASKHITQQPPCDLYMVSDSLISAQQSFAFPAGSKYTPLFNAELLKMREAGELRNLEHKWFPAQCENSVVDIEASGTYEFSRFYKLDLGAFSGAVLILGIGLILGGLAAVIECCIYKWAETKVDEDEVKGEPEPEENNKLIDNNVVPSRGGATQV